MISKPAFRNMTIRSVSSRVIGSACAAVFLLGVAACGGPAPMTYDLSAPATGVKAHLSGQIVIPTPTALQAFGEQRIVVRDVTGAMTFLGGGQWADQLPDLLQARLINTFENASKLRAVALPSSGVMADYQLVTDIRAFYVVTPGNEAVVELSVRLINARSGQIVRGKVFSARRPVGDNLNAGSAAVALNDALSSVLLEIARWVG